MDLECKKSERILRGLCEVKDTFNRSGSLDTYNVRDDVCLSLSVGIESTLGQDVPHRDKGRRGGRDEGQ